MMEYLKGIFERAFFFRNAVLIIFNQIQSFTFLFQNVWNSLDILESHYLFPFKLPFTEVEKKGRQVKARVNPKRNQQVAEDLNYNF